MNSNNNNRPSRKPLTNRQMQVYETGFNMGIRLILVIAVIIAFFMILIKILNSEPSKMSIVYLAVEGLLVGTLYVVYKHYFPSK